VPWIALVAQAPRLQWLTMAGEALPATIILKCAFDSVRRAFYPEPVLVFRPLAETHDSELKPVNASVN